MTVCYMLELTLTELLQVSVPANYEFAIMDLPGISQGSPYQAHLLQSYLEESEAQLFVLMGSRARGTFP